MTQEEPNAPPAPFKDLKIGKRFYFDSDEIKLLRNELLIDVTTCPTDMVVEAQSLIDLGAGHKIERFYVEDGYFQVKYEGEAKIENVSQVLFVSFDASEGYGPDRQEQLDDESNRMLSDFYLYRDKTFNKDFTAEFDEHVTNSSGESYVVYNRVSVFNRQIESGGTEMLIIAIEDCDGITISTALAIDIPFSRIEPALA